MWKCIIFDQMVVIQEISLGFDGEVKEPVSGKEPEKVVQKGIVRLDIGPSCSVQIERQRDLSFLCIPFDGCISFHVNCPRDPQFKH